MTERKHTTIGIIIGLFILIAIGAALRLFGLGVETIGHIEINTPGIDLPIGLSDIPPRLTLLKSISGPIAGEPHPPGFYVLMFFWTKLFGAGIFALRLPAALFGIGCIVLVFVLALQTEANKWIALLAAGMLAFNGSHIYWSRVAKMMTMGTFLALLATVLLVWLVTNRYRQWLVLASYIVVMLVGLGTTVFVWPIFAAHLVWITAASLTNRRISVGTLRWLLFTFILASPLWAVAAYQSRRPSYLNAEGLLTVFSQYFQLGFLFQPSPDTVLTPVVSLGLLGVLLLGLFLLVAGLFIGPPGKTVGVVTLASPPRWLMVVSAVGMSVAIGIFALASRQKDPVPFPLVLACAIVPILIFVVDMMVNRFWTRWQSVASAKLARFASISDLHHLNSIAALLPPVLLLLISLFMPVLAQRNALMATPFLLIVLSRGVIGLWLRDRRWAIVIVLVLTIQSVSIIHFMQKPHHPNDYKGVADQWIPQITPDDLVFVQPHWATTPIFYYLDADRYHVVGQNYAEAVKQNPDARIWVLSFEDLPHPPAMDAVLAERDSAETFTALNTSVTLYE